MTPSGMITIRYTGDTRRSEVRITGKGKDWWPGELRTLPMARGLQLVGAGQGWERDDDEDDIVAITPAQRDAGAVGVAVVDATGQTLGPNGSPVSGAGTGLAWLQDWLLRRDMPVVLDSVMASPPTIAVQAGAFSGYSKAWPSTVTDNAFWAGVADFTGGFMARATNRIKPRSVTSAPGSVTSPLAITGFEDVLTGMEWYGDADVYSLQINTSSANPWRILVDEFDGKGLLYTSLTGHVAAQTGDSYMRLTFASAKTRRIVLEGPTSWAFSRIYTTPVYSVWAPQRRIPRIALVGDSFAVGPVAGPPAQYTSPVAPINQDGFANHLKRLFDADVWVMATGGTGWGQGFSGKPSFDERWYDALNLMPDGVTPRSTWTPDIIVVPGSYNSNGLTTTVITSAMQSFYNNIRARNATVPIVFSGPIQRPSDNATGLSAERDTAMAAWAAGIMASDRRVGYYSVTGANNKWWTGTGYQGATTGIGNTDTLTGEDGAHPSYLGHRVLAQRHVAAIALAVAGMA